MIPIQKAEVDLRAVEVKAKIEEDILQPLTSLSGRFYLAVALLGLLAAWGAYAWATQLRYGMGVTGLNRPIFWGVYITDFVFFIGISHAGTLISSILRITKTEWRRVFTRIAEAVTVFSLPFGALSIIFDMGRPDRLLNVLKTPHLTSPIIWDVLCISTYLFTSCVYFYLALIPDFAVCRDRLRNVSSFRAGLYRILAAGWTGSERQWRTMDRTMRGLCIFLFFLVVSVHTNVSFVFGMTLQPGWHTAVIGPYFVLGAVYSGVATVILIAALLRKVYHLEAYLTPRHFDLIGKFLFALACFWFYFTFVEFLTTFYGQEPAHMRIFTAKFFQEFSFLFWFMFATTFVVPVVILAVRRTIPWLVVASILINIGMWLERYTIIVPSLSRPRLPYPPGVYFPSWVEWSIMIGSFAGFSLLYVIFAKFFPVLTIWEVKEAKPLD